MTKLLLCRRGSLMTGGAPKWRTIKTVFSLPGSDDLEGGIFQSNWYVRFRCIASGHLFLFEIRIFKNLFL
jgi:hypothetical protein